MGTRFGVRDVAIIFHSIWAMLKDRNSTHGTTYYLPPFEGHFGYEMSSWDPNTTEASLKWYVQEEPGDGLLELPLKRSEFLCLNNNMFSRGVNAFITTTNDGCEPPQCKGLDYNPPKAAQFSSGHRYDPRVDDRRANNGSPNVRESCEEIPPPHSPTINLNIEPGAFREHGSRAGLSPNTAHDGVTAHRARSLLKTPSRNIHLAIPKRHEGRHSVFNRAGRSAEEVRGYADQPRVRMPRGPYDMLGPESDHRYQSQARMPPGPYSRLASYSDRRYQHLAHNQVGRGPSVVETSENYLHQNLDPQCIQDQEMALNDPPGYQAATTRHSYQADNSPSLDSLLEVDTFDCEASHFSNLRPAHDPLQGSHDVYQDSTCTPSLSSELSHDQLGDLTVEKPDVLPLCDEFGTDQQASFFPALVPKVYTGQYDQLNYQDHSTGGLRLPTVRNDESTLDKLIEMRSRISSRLRGLRPEYF